MAKVIKKLEDIVPDPKNANKGTERGLAMVEQSLRENGAGRSIVTDKNGVVIGGNKTLESAASIGMEVQVVKSDGKKLIVVQRDDLDLMKDDNARRLAYADNRSSQLGLEWDLDQIQLDIDEGIDLSGVFTDKELEIMIDDSDIGLSENYNRKITAPIYEPKGDKPEISELYDSAKTERMNQIIRDADISDDIKAFLHIASSRHTVLDFHNIAEYYAHAPIEIQELMEQSALVIIDFDKAIENGFVQMSKSIANLVEEDYGHG